MLTILVSRFKVNIITVDGRNCQVQGAFVERNGHFVHMRACESFPDIAAVEIVVMRWRRFWTLMIPMRVQESVIAFLRQYHGKCDLSFDCYAFVNLVWGIPQHKVIDAQTHWKTRPYWLWSRPRPGDVVFLLNEELNFFYHAAVYLGMGLYLSVYGAGGDLEITSLRDMKRAFGAAYTRFAQPRC